MAEIRHTFVGAVPASLEANTVYICNEYDVAVHLCLCGCGANVVTPFGPSEWSLISDGQTISLSPSVGNGALPCHSHYWITRSTVRWLPPVTTTDQRAAASRDARDLQAEIARDAQWWRRLVRVVRSLWQRARS
jgi:hypothetical protein